MTISHHKEDSIDIVTLTDRLTAADVNTARREINEIINAGEGKLLVDISGLDFVDSSGLGLLVGCHQEARNKDGNLVLLEPQPEVKALLELTRLDQVFRIFHDQSEAITSLN